MNKKSRWVWTALLLCMASLRAEKGIVVAVYDGYAHFFLPSLAHLRFNLECELPIEVWHSGDELSAENQALILQFPHVRLRDISRELGVDPLLYRGWHIKPKCIELSSFDEVILMDADVYFYQKPEKLFDHLGYKRTGAFFFRDRARTKIPYSEGGIPVYKERFLLPRYVERREFFRSLIAEPGDSLPQEWRIYWTDEVPTYQKPTLADHQESGVVALDKRRHKESLEHIVALNENRAVTYQFVWGDKETFWLGCEMAKAPYHMNTQLPYGLYVKRAPFQKDKYIHLVHFVDGELFFQQKHPPKIGFRSAHLYDDLFGEGRSLNEEERSKIEQAYQMKQMFVEHSSKRFRKFFKTRNP